MSVGHAKQKKRMKPPFATIVTIGFLACCVYAIACIWYVIPDGDDSNGIVEACYLFHSDGTMIMSIHFDHTMNLYDGTYDVYGRTLEDSIACLRENECAYYRLTALVMSIQQPTYVNVTHLLSPDVKLWIHPRVVSKLNLSHVPATTIKNDIFEPFTKNYVKRSILNVAIEVLTFCVRVGAWIFRLVESEKIVFPAIGEMWGLGFVMFHVMMVVAVTILVKTMEKEKKKKKKKKKTKDE